MIKSQQAQSKPSICWWKELQIPALRVELDDGAFFVFPYLHLGFAKMETQKEQNVLLLSFSSHDVRITGRNLKDLGIAIQRLSVEWVRKTNTRYVTLAKKDAAIIEKIEVEARDASFSLPPPAQEGT